jgi:hypothetical protein
MDKTRILAEIRRTASENGGVALGQARFAKETGISFSAWRGKYWRKWSEATSEAGFAPNLLAAYPSEMLVLAMAKLTKQNGRFPTDPDLRMARRADPSLPGSHAFYQLGSRQARIELLRVYASQHPEHDNVLALLPGADVVDVDEGNRAESAELANGSVYMLKLGKAYKVGKTFSVPRRHREIALELPEKPDVIHVITTDDPTGIEAYWHKRFATKRTNGEWFSLTRDDIRAFKRRKFM